MPRDAKSDRPNLAEPGRTWHVRSVKPPLKHQTYDIWGFTCQNILKLSLSICNISLSIIYITHTHTHTHTAPHGTIPPLPVLAQRRCRWSFLHQWLAFLQPYRSSHPAPLPGGFTADGCGRPGWKVTLQPELGRKKWDFTGANLRNSPATGGIEQVTMVRKLAKMIILPPNISSFLPARKNGWPLGTGSTMKFPPKKRDGSLLGVSSHLASGL